MIYFWREKNADKCAGKGKIVEPTREQLEEELILKVEQKLSRIDVVFDCNAREEYYLTDKKPKKRLDGMSEKEIVQLLGRKLAVDFAQLSFDLSDFYGFDKNFDVMVEATSVQAVKEKVVSILESLKKKDNRRMKMQIENLFGCAREIAKLSDASWEDVEALRCEREENEGSFFRGKYVVFDEE